MATELKASIFSRYFPWICQIIVLLPIVSFILLTRDAKNILLLIVSYCPLLVPLVIAFALPLLVVIEQNRSKRGRKLSSLGIILCWLALAVGLTTDAVLIVGVSICC